MFRELLQPSPIRTFALKALGIFVLWYVFHELWLLPDGRLDHWVALRVIDGAAFVTKLIGFEVWIQGRVVTIAGNNGIEMVDGCTGGRVLLSVCLSLRQAGRQGPPPLPSSPSPL